MISPEHVPDSLEITLCVCVLVMSASRLTTFSFSHEAYIPAAELGNSMQTMRFVFCSDCWTIGKNLSKLYTVQDPDEMRRKEV